MLNACGAPQSHPGASAERETGGWETAAWATVEAAEAEDKYQRDWTWQAQNAVLGTQNQTLRRWNKVHGTQY